MNKIISHIYYIYITYVPYFFLFLCSKALIAEEKLIHVETPGSYQQVALSEFCITPSEDQTLKFDVKAGSDAMTLLFTDSGTSVFFLPDSDWWKRKSCGYFKSRKPWKTKKQTICLCRSV